MGSSDSSSYYTYLSERVRKVLDFLDPHAKLAWASKQKHPAPQVMENRPKPAAAMSRGAGVLHSISHSVPLEL